MAIDLHKELARVYHQRGEEARKRTSELVLGAVDPTGPEVLKEGQRVKLHESKAAFFVRVAEFMSRLVSEEKLPEPTIGDYLEVLRLREKEVQPSMEQALLAPRRVGRGRLGLAFEDKEVALNAKRQYPIAVYLLRRAGQVVTTEELARSAYGSADRRRIQCVRNDIMDIRADLEEAGVRAQIQTVEGGYRMMLGEGEQGVKTVEKAGASVSLGEAVKRTGLGAATLKNYAEKGLLQEGAHFVRRKFGGGKSTLDFTQEGVQFVRDVRRHVEKGTRPQVRTLIERIKSRFATREKRLADYRQVRMDTNKAVKLADLLSSMPLDLGARYGVELDQETRAFCSAVWRNFYESADCKKYNAEFFRTDVIPRLRRDLLSFCEDPAGAYRFFQERPELSKFKGSDEARVPFYRVVASVQLLLERIDPKERARFVEELVSMKGPLLRQAYPGSPVERAR